MAASQHRIAISAVACHFRAYSRYCGGLQLRVESFQVFCLSYVSVLARLAVFRLVGPGPAGWLEG